MQTTAQRYRVAQELFGEYGLSTDAALTKLSEIPVSLHCWQIDDLSGFEDPSRGLSGGIASFGNAPGKPSSREEFVANLSRALSLIPGRNKLALHAIYLNDHGKPTGRDEIQPSHFAEWVDFAKDKNLGLDFNPTYFSHPMADSGFTLSSIDPAVRQYWINHGIQCRRIGDYFGRELNDVCINNHWIPDGYKDYTIDKLSPRLRLADSLDQLFREKLVRNKDAVESKLFGLGSESYVTGSHEFYTNYAAIRNNCMVCMDMGHFHPTETVSSKLSSYVAFGRELMLHVSRPVRWDSDHVVIVDDETREVMLEIVRMNVLDQVHIGTDYFDASINRIVATVIGARSIKKCLLYALLQPADALKSAEAKDDFTTRLALNESVKDLPYGLVWDMFCEQNNMPGRNWFEQEPALV